MPRFRFIESTHTLNGFILFNVLSALNAIIFIIYNEKSTFPVLAISNLSARKLLLFIILAAPLSFIVSYSAISLNSLLTSDSGSMNLFFAAYPYSKTITIIFVAILPAIFEELAYRGFLLHTLKEVVDDRQAIFISSFLFAIIHISFISLYWLLPFALLLGYLCVKQKNIWYGVAVHFIFNLTACLIEFYSLL